MRMMLPAALAAALIATTGASHAAPQDVAPATAPATGAQQTALQLLDRLDAGDFAAVEASFTDEMRQQVPGDELRQVWSSLPQQLGAATGRGEPQMVEQDGFQVVMVPLMFERGVLLSQTAIDAQGKVAGFLLQPAQPAPPEGAAPQDAPPQS